MPEPVGDLARHVADELEVRALAERYAAAVDGRDVDAFLGVFDEDATLSTHPDGAAEPRSVFHGHGELARIIDRIQVYPQTFHFVGNHRVSLDRPDASGEVYCLAHHLTPDAHGGTDLVMLIRYQDTYRCTDRWRITRRRVVVDWMEYRVTGTGGGASGTPRQPAAPPGA
jgi:hypothetical protein